MGPEIVMFQRWNRLLFAHWRVDPAELRTLVPPGLELDLWGDEAWIGLIPFTMDRIRPRGLPPLVGITSLREVNLRTYVRRGGISGVWFFSLDATSEIAVRAARLFYRLPYHRAAISVEDEDGWIHYSSNRILGGAGCRLRYRAIAPPMPTAPGSLEHFLIERYYLFATRGDRVWSARVYHDPYAIATASVADFDETLCAAAGVNRNGAPELMHYSPSVSVRIGRLRRA